MLLLYLPARYQNMIKTDSKIKIKIKNLEKIQSDLERWEELATEYISYIKKEGDFRDTLRFNLLTPELLNLIGNVRGKRIIDAGCGEGYLSRGLSREGASVIGIDASKTMIREALLQEKSENLGTKFILCDLTNPIPIEGNSVDLIIANMVFFSVKDIETMVNNLTRYLIPGGQFVFSILHPCFHLSESQWQNIHLLNRKNSDLTIKLSESYHEEKILERPYIDSAHKIKVYLRPIDYYLRLFFKNGFTVTDFREPIQRLDEVREGDRYYHAYFLPRFLIVKCNKL